MQFKPGSLYYVEFYDHVCGDHTDMKCQFVGWCTGESEIKVYLSPWLVVSDDQELVANNLEKVSLIKSTIIKKKELKL